MKKLFKFRAPSFDAQAINETIRSKLEAAGLDTTAGPMRGVTDIIRRSLAAASLPAARSGVVANEDVIDVVARVVDVAPGSASTRQRSTHPQVQSQSSPPLGGSFESHEYANQAGARTYKLYVPAQIAAAPPLVIMLHGCTQSPDDFAVGTCMNQLAEEHGFLVAYPEQPSSANPSKCWSWFKPQDQARNGGEPSLIVGIAQVVAARYNVDRQRIFVAGMSAGAAMAVILGETYPEVFAGVGAHSGLPYCSANDIPSALLAMKGGRSGMPSLKTKLPLAGQAKRQTIAKHAVPSIVFHGDRDHTVQQSNATEIVQQAKNAHSAAKAAIGLQVNTKHGTCASGRSFTRTFYTDTSGVSRIESWTVQGAGHAWSGGDASGSYTDASGPNASAEMVRFFLSLQGQVRQARTHA